MHSSTILPYANDNYAFATSDTIYPPTSGIKLLDYDRYAFVQRPKRAKCLPSRHPSARGYLLNKSWLQRTRASIPERMKQAQIFASHAARSVKQS